MVHVLTSVLRKVHDALREQGGVLILQPEEGSACIACEIKGETALSEALQEPNFSTYLRATRTAIEAAVAEGLFVIEEEAVVPEDEDESLVEEYTSVDEWLLDIEDFCEDWDEIEGLAGRLRILSAGEPSVVRESWRQYRVLLRKTNPQTSARHNV